MLNWLKRILPAPPSPTPPESLVDALRLEGMDLESLRAGLPRLYASLPEHQLDLLPRCLSNEVKAHLAQAEKILRHEFNLLGSGDFVPVDPDREERQDYRPIDWYLDPVRGLRFPRGIPVKEWDLYAMRPENADIKYPWELARCQHWPALGQAWLLSGDERFAREIRDQLDDFREANPVGIGVNWTCTMDVAIRALNWALALDMMDALKRGDEFGERAVQALFEHGHFIYNNLENHYEVTSNHFLSNVVGLFYLSFLFSSLEAGRTWQAFCREALEKEIVAQVLDDGADYESSVPYHRLVTELFLGAARLAELSGAPLSENCNARLEKMVEFLAGVLRPDGLMPQVGDADDGRLHILSRYGRWQPQDPRHLFGPAARYFDRPDWSSLGGPDGVWEAIWWGYAFDEDELRSSRGYEGTPADNIRLYPHAGLAVAREKGNYLLVTNGIVGTKGFGNHKHNDQLGFEYFCQGVPLFVDPGSYVYTSDFAARNRYRSVKAHNTLCIDDTEQNEMREEWIFRLFETSHAEHLSFEVSEGQIEYAGRHSGYQRLPQKVRHRRTTTLCRKGDGLLVVDELEGNGKCSLEWNFHCAPGVEVFSRGQGAVLLAVGERRFELLMSEQMDITKKEDRYSSSYGVECPSSTITLKSEVDLSEKCAWKFEIRSLDPERRETLG